MRSIIAFTAILLLMLGACRKKNSVKPEPGYPLLKTARYSDNLGTIDNVDELIYYPGGSKLQQVKTRFININAADSSEQRYVYTDQQVERKQFYRVNTEVPGSGRRYILDEKGRAVVCNFYDPISAGPAQFSYSYNNNGYLAKIEITRAGVKTLQLDYYYSTNNRLDSQVRTGFVNGVGQKIQVARYEYNLGFENTIGDYAQFSLLSTSFLDYNKIYGRQQAFLLSKEVIWFSTGSTWYKGEENIYEYVKGGAGLIAQRTARSTAYQANGSVISSANRVHTYSYYVQ